MSDPLEVYAIRYATMHGRRASEVFYRYDLYGLEDRTMDMDCYFWLIRSGSTVTLVDCGWDRQRGLPAAGGRYSHVAVDETNPIELLARLGVAPEDVDSVIVSHMHFDHVGNLDLFPDANLIISRAEYECWTGPYAGYAALSHSTHPRDVQRIQNFALRKRLHLVERLEEVVTGVLANPVGGHTPGQMIVEVSTGAGTVVLASDAVHYQEELYEGRPFYVYTDLIAMIDTYELLRAKAATADTWVVTGHDPVEMSRFDSVNQDCVDLSKPR